MQIIMIMAASCGAARARRFRSHANFWAAALLLAGGSLSAANAEPVLVPDGKNPGHYKPFHCLSVDRNVGPAEGGIRNDCGHDVEAYWLDGKGGGAQWTIAAGGWYPLYGGISGTILGCMPNDHLNRSLSLCKDSSHQPARSADADQLAKDLGVQARGGKAQADKVDADRLATQLGVPIAPSESEYTATQLQDDLARWETQQQHAREEQERQRQERERIAAVERAKREQIMLENQRQRSHETPVASDDDDGGGLEMLGAVVGAVAKTAYDIEVQKTQLPPRNAPSPAPASSGGYSSACDQGRARVASIIQDCNADAARGACQLARTMAACAQRAASAASGCPEAEAQAQHYQREYEVQAQGYCAP